MTDSYEKVKFIVTRNVLIFTCFAMSILVLMNLFVDSNNIITAIVALFFSTSVLIYLLKSKSYLIPAIIAIILGYSINLFNLFKASNFENFIDIFWLINLSIFAYFTLGKLIGHIYLTINIGTIFIISTLVKFNIITLVPVQSTLDMSMLIEFGTNLLMCTFFFGYIISEFIEQNNLARKDSVKSNIELQKQYDEKSTMLKEIHHRVKNNLQVVTSLLRLQLYKIENETAIIPFQESIDRISSMALIHDKMYKGDKVKAINIKEYINDLAENLIKNYANEKHINLTISSSVQTIELNHIVPLSLILNELISNSLKHAFQNENTGEIIVNISTNEATHLKLCYKDNGIWQSPKDPSSFGLELIDTFTEQLNGTYTLETLNGTYYCFQFKDIIIKK